MKKILVGLDGSPLAETILPFVEMLAKKTGARVTLLHVVPPPDQGPSAGADHPAIDQMVRASTQRAEGYLAEQRRRFAATGLGASIEVVAGPAAHEIVSHAERGGYDLIALATHGRSGVERWTHGSVADQVLHATKIPLLLVRPGDGWQAVPREPHRLVLMLDGSPESETALDLAVPLATRFSLPLLLFRFVEPIALEFGDPLGTAYADVERITNATAESALDHLETLATTLRKEKGVNASAKVAVAGPAEGITAYVRDHPDSLVVLTTHGRTGWRRALLGSVARRVVQSVAAPILICPARMAPVVSA
jgi:nucleotide-binding universal stress UspA family protein